ncbi:hypothetical protein BHE74_00044170, partial [Ensete ventricosum]
LEKEELEMHSRADPAEACSRRRAASRDRDKKPPNPNRHRIPHPKANLLIPMAEAQKEQILPGDPSHDVGSLLLDSSPSAPQPAAVDAGREIRAGEERGGGMHPGRGADESSREEASSCLLRWIRTIWENAHRPDMLPGLQEGQEKMSKSDPSSSIYMEDEEAKDSTIIILLVEEVPIRGLTIPCEICMLYCRRSFR